MFRGNAELEPLRSTLSSLLNIVSMIQDSEDLSTPAAAILIVNENAPLALLRSVIQSNLSHFR